MRRASAILATLVAALAVAVPAARAADPTLVAAGDIACIPGKPTTAAQCQMAATGSAVQALSPDAVAALGDNQYESGTLAQFNASFDPTWGESKALIHPAAGNHEYLTTGAAGYFAYFGSAAGDPSRGYYSYDLGAWHVVVVNSNCEVVSCAAGSAQELWLHNDLATHRNVCTLAYWHHPLFTSGPTKGQPDNLAVKPLWEDLYDAGADLILNGHDHSYERFAQQTPAGAADPGRGIRQIVVGTGGDDLYTFDTDEPNSEARYDTPTFGVLSVQLHPRSYAWQFHPVAGGSYTDSGTTQCYDRPPAASFALSSAKPATGETVAFDGSGSSDPDGTVTGYEWDFGDGSRASGPRPSYGYTRPGTYTVRLTVTDDGGNQSSTSRTVTVSDGPPGPVANPPAAPKAAFTISPRSPAATKAARFDASSSTGPARITSYKWSFGDGGSGTGKVVHHIFKRPGTYQARLTVADTAGGAASISRTVAVAGRPPTASMRIVYERLGALRRRGLDVRLRADRRSRAEILVEIGRARALGLGFKEADDPVVIAKRRFALRPGRIRAVRLPLAREARNRLARTHRTVVTVITLLRTGDGGRRVLSRTVRLRR